MSLPEGEDVTAPPFPGHRQAPSSGFGVKNVQGMYQRQNEPKLLCRLSAERPLYERNTWR